MNLLNWASVSAAFAVLTALGLYFFPGHTFLLSDTQIYIPLFTHIRNPELLNQELILSGAHLTYTVYDEVTLAISSLFHIDFESALFAQQFLFRWLGLWGAYWLARAIHLSQSASILTSALLWMGAFVYGPAVITTEFEPVPRGFAVCLVVAALGALARNHLNIASAAIALAFLYHAPAVWPVLAVAMITRHWRPILSTAAAAMLLLVFAGQQSGTVEAQPFFSVITAPHRAIMQARAPYNWISLWPARHWLQFLLTGGLAYLAYRRLKDLLPETVRPYFHLLPLLGILTMPLSYLGLEIGDWALLPQIQPMRALLFCHLFCQWLGILVAAIELKNARWLQAFLWLIVPVSLSLRGDILWLTPNQFAKQGALLALLLLGAYIAYRFPKPQLAIAASLLLSITFGEVFHARAYVPVETQGLDDLAGWAQLRTPIDAQFLFADLGRRPEPGIFRARASRAVYVCWKQGGQVNYFPKYASIWWERWTQLLAPNHPPLDYNNLRSRGITHLVFTKDNPSENLIPVYASPEYRVYQLTP